MYVALIFLAALIHESGHLTALSFFGARTKIKINSAGLVIEKQGGSLSYVADLIISISGPIANLVTFLIFCKNPNEYLLFLADASLILGLVNILPIKKLDGSLAIYSLLSIIIGERASRIAVSLLSYVFMGAFFIIGICLLLTSEPNPTFFIMYAWLFYNIYLKNDKNG
jgi:Zn-dependent protease